MKKEYTIPALEIFHIESAILASSPDDEEKVDLIFDPEEEDEGIAD